MPPYGLIAFTAWLGMTASGRAVAGCTPAQSQPIVRGKLSASTVIPYRQLPVELCLDIDAATAKALHDGSARLFLHLQNQQPSSRYSPSFTLRLVEAGAPCRPPLAELSMHPDHVDGSGQAEAQHFSFDLSERFTRSAAAGPLCLELGIDLAGDDAADLETHQVKVTADLGPDDLREGSSRERL